MEIFVALLLLIYAVLITLGRHAWNKIPLNQEIENTALLPGVSVVIPVRNEEGNINKLIESLDRLQYPSDKLEFIIVDDASEDGTMELLQLNTLGKDTYRYFSLEEPEGFDGSYKKRALTAAIESAVFPVIVTTDADCQFHPKWLASFVGTMHLNDLVMASGPVSYSQTGFWSSALHIELASLIAVGAASLNRGYPNMCNGANLAFTREAFIEVNGYKGYEQVVSGDDEFLLHKIFNKYPEQVGFVKHRNSIVQTTPPESWKEFIHQRKRWSSKWKSYKSKATRVMTLFVFIFHLALLVSLTMTVLGWYSWKILMVQLAVKVSLEIIFVRPVLDFLGKRASLQWFFLMQLLYSLYVVFIGTMVQFTGFDWKNRKYP